MDVQPSEKASSNDRLERFIKLAPVLLASWTAIFLLNGRSYRDGYLQHFHLNATMFDDDISDLVTLSVSAWVELVVRILHLIEAKPIATLLTLFAVVGSPLLLSWFLFLNTVRLHRRRDGKVFSARRKPVAVSKWSKAKRIRRNLQRVFLRQRIPSWAKSFRRRVWMATLFGYLGYTGVTFVGFVLISLVLPFQYLGDRVATRDQATKFVNQPSVMLSDPNGKNSSYRIILCAEHFCGPYGNKEIVTVPLSAITWGISDLPPTSTIKETTHD